MASPHSNKHTLIASLVENLHGISLTHTGSDEVRKTYQSFRARSRAMRSIPERIADRINSVFGSITFASLHFIWFSTWLIINTGLVPFIAPFDPYPFGLLTMVVSLEAIFLSIFVLISQNRESSVGDVRSEVEFQINANAEREITKVMVMVSDIQKHLGMEIKADPELERMKKRLDPSRIEKQILKEVESA